jgi:hypothetical protein
MCTAAHILSINTAYMGVMTHSKCVRLYTHVHCIYVCANRLSTFWIACKQAMIDYPPAPSPTNTHTEMRDHINRLRDKQLNVVKVI